MANHSFFLYWFDKIRPSFYATLGFSVLAGYSLNKTNVQGGDRRQWVPCCYQFSVTKWVNCLKGGKKTHLSLLVFSTNIIITHGSFSAVSNWILIFVSIFIMRNVKHRKLLPFLHCIALYYIGSRFSPWIIILKQFVDRHHSTSSLNTLAYIS